MKMIGHDDETMDMRQIIFYQPFERLNNNFFGFISLKQGLPVADGSCMEIHDSNIKSSGINCAFWLVGRDANHGQKTRLLQRRPIETDIGKR